MIARPEVTGRRIGKRSTQAQAQEIHGLAQPAPLTTLSSFS
jgi:hypothetical protein